MFTGQLNRVSAACRMTILLWAICALVLAVGCGGKDEPEPAPQPDSEAMVPVAAGSTLAGSAVIDTVAAAVTATTEPVGTSTSESVSPVVSTKETATRSRAESAPEAVSDPSSRTHVDHPAGDYSLQLGSFRSADNARARAERINTLGYTPAVEVATLGGQTYHRVVLRGLGDRDAAERIGEKIRSQLGITYLIRQK